jgi:hypothetical protein
LPDESLAIELGDAPAAILPMDVKTPVALSTVYIETSSEPAFAT